MLVTTKHIRARGMTRTTQNLESQARTKTELELIAGPDSISEKARIGDGWSLLEKSLVTFNSQKYWGAYGVIL
ncbi:hypothetical protein BC826DRAFT_1058245 [Russula brevipes]|nr:hypothetical protein BC826DRAFT_1058245 [Russula brevipes]